MLQSAMQGGAMTIKEVITRYIGWSVEIHGDFLAPQFRLKNVPGSWPIRDHKIEGAGDELFWASRGGEFPGTLFIPYSSVSCVLEYKSLPTTKKQQKQLGTEGPETRINIYLASKSLQDAQRVTDH